MDFFKSISDKVSDAVEERFGQLNLLGGILKEESHSHTHIGHDCATKHPEEHTNNRYCSFVPESSGQAKWYVDGATYFWALSMALEGEILSFLQFLCHLLVSAPGTSDE